MIIELDTEEDWKKLEEQYKVHWKTIGDVRWMNI